MINSLHQDIHLCRKCPLGFSCNNHVTGIGPLDAKIALIGEAPGEDEDIMGEPFVGMCGQFLDKMLISAGLDRKELYITNAVKCRPTKNNGKANRPPSDSEIAACKSWLWKEINLVKPTTIITLGKVPTGLLLSKKTFTLSDMVGIGYSPAWTNATIFPCYHPSYIMVRDKSKELDAVNLFKYVKGI